MSTTPSNLPDSYSCAVESLPELDVLNWPLVDSGWRSVVIVASTIGVGILSARVSGSMAMGLLASLALTLSMWRFWVPVRYFVRGRGLVVNRLGRQHLIRWRTIQQYRLRKRGVVLVLRDEGRLFDGLESRYIDGRGQLTQLAAAIDFYRKP